MSDMIDLRCVWCRKAFRAIAAVKYCCESCEDADSDSPSARIATLEAELAAEKTRAERLDIALQSLTPGGSEYVNNPERCVAFVRDVRTTQHEVILRRTGEKNAAEARFAALVAAAEPFCRHYEPWMDKWSNDTRCTSYAGATFGQLRALRTASRLGLRSEDERRPKEDEPPR